VYIVHGKIAEKPAPGARVIDAMGKVICPGFIDLHAHLREPGQEEKETIQTGTLAAAKGGFTSICCMPNTVPPIDNAAIVEMIKNRKSSVNLLPIACISKGREGKELVDMGELVRAGAVGFSDDGGWVSNSRLMRRAMEYAAMFKSVVMSHCEDHTLSADGVMNEGFLSTKLGLRPHPIAAEAIAVARELVLAESYGPVHLAHISAKESVELIRWAKKKGIPVTAETCPHYFSLTEDAVDGYDTSAKVNPPLRTAKDVQAIIKGLQDGTLDAISTDHAPHTFDDKHVEFDHAAFGISGFETAFALGVSTLVKPGKLTLKQLIATMTVGPSRILRLEKKASLQPGYDADLVILDPAREWTVDVRQFVSKGKNSPFNGWTLTGAVEKTIVGGQVVWEG
jgi:dihydroorotase